MDPFTYIIATSFFSAVTQHFTRKSLGSAVAGDGQYNRAFQEREGERNRAQQREEGERNRAFQDQQAAQNRAHQREEAERNRAFQEHQAALNREHQREEGEKGRAFQWELFVARREDERRLAEERRAQEWAMAERQRQTALELQENQMVLSHWPLRLFPSQILNSHRGDGPTPLRVLLSLPASGPKDLEGPVRQALHHFVATHYNINQSQRPIELLDGAWKDGQFQGLASIKALHDRLGSEPTLVLETQMPEGDDTLYVNLAYWGPGQDQVLYQPLEKIAYRPLVDAAARAGAEQWRSARESLIAKGLARDETDADQRLGGLRAVNLQRLEQEEALTAAGIALDQVELPPFKYTKDDYRAIHQFLITWHSLTVGWLGDLYHFSYWDTPPLLPSLLPDLLDQDFPPEIAHAFLDHYCRSYRGVAADRPSWSPELTLNLVYPLTALPDPRWALDQTAHAIQDWLALRGLPAIPGSGSEVIEGLCVAAEGPAGPLLLDDGDFYHGLRLAVDRLHRPDLAERLAAAERGALAQIGRERLERERQERLERDSRERQERLERERGERERAEAAEQAAREPQDIHGWPADRMQELQRATAQWLGLEVGFRLPLKDGGEGPEMLVIPPGSYLMGASENDNEAGNDEKPAHRVTIARPFAIGRYAVTFDEYDRFCAATRWYGPNDYGWGHGRRPVIFVSWEVAVAYCAWLTAQTGKTYRLPTEAEWEYAARAGTTTAYWWGNEIGRGNANCWRGGTKWGNKKTAPVGSLKPNPFGLYDTVGNVLEWVQDPWHDNYQGAPVDGSEWRGGGDTARRVCRGGCWYFAPEGARVSSRICFDSADCYPWFGVRLAQDL
jgi:formylglycine-generating enzyme required for sulfatase activity